MSQPYMQCYQTQSKVLLESLCGGSINCLEACKSRARKRGWGRTSILSMLTYNSLFILFVIIELFPNSVFHVYCPKRYYKQKKWNNLPVKMIR